MAEVVSVVALLVSLASLAVAIYTASRDRGRLRASARFVSTSEYRSPASVKVSVVNAGRRPVILRMWAGEAGKEWIGTFFDRADGGLRLGENEHEEFELEKSDLLATTPDGHFIVEDLWVEDSLGKRHRVKGAIAALKRLWAS